MDTKTKKLVFQSGSKEVGVKAFSFAVADFLLFFPPPGRWRAQRKKPYMREKGGNEHLWLCQPHLRSPITIPPLPRARCGRKERDKGRREMQRKEEIVGEIYRPLQQAAEG